MTHAVTLMSRAGNPLIASTATYRGILQSNMSVSMLLLEGAR